MIPITAREIIGKGWRPFGQRYSVVSGEFITVSGDVEYEFHNMVAELPGFQLNGHSANMAFIFLKAFTILPSVHNTVRLTSFVVF